MKKTVFLLIVFLFASMSIAAALPKAFGQDALGDAASELLSNPRLLLVFAIQLGIGFGLGYVSMKALKYVIAIIAILALGVLLNVWQIGGYEEFLQKLGFTLDLPQVMSMLGAVASVLGILTILPVGVGFLVGVVVAARK